MTGDRERKKDRGRTRRTNTTCDRAESAVYVTEGTCIQNGTPDIHIHSTPACTRPRTELEDGILIFPFFLFSALPFVACGEGGGGYIDPDLSWCKSTSL